MTPRETEHREPNTSAPVEPTVGAGPGNQQPGPTTGAAKTMEGKESLSIDLGTEAGRKIAQQVAARADVVVNGFRPGVAERMGFDYTTLSALNPKLRYMHACGHGPDGPYAKRTGTGQFVASSMLTSGMYTYSDACTYAGEPELRQSDPEQFGLSALYRLYEAEVGWVFVGAEDDDTTGQRSWA
jgi:crotonobetainyl-CoA:carnitine CoA-transferase CaiB-like acyl-CoA transferase